MHEGPVVVFAGGGTGGHLYPALALADELVRQRPDVRPFFLGARGGIEARVLPGRGGSIGFSRCEGSHEGSGGRISGYPWPSRPRLRPRSESNAASGRSWSW